MKRLLGILIVLLLFLPAAACSVVTVTYTPPTTTTQPLTTETVTTTPPPAPYEQYSLAPIRVLPVGGFPFNVACPPYTGEDYILQLPVYGGIPPYTWAPVAGNLPPGLSLESKGWVTGVPESTGMWTFSAMVTDATGNTATGSIQLNVYEKPDFNTPTPTVDGPADARWVSGKYVEFIVNYPVEMPDLAADQYLAVTPMAMGNNVPWNFIAIGLPEGLVCDPVTGTIQGPVSAFADGSVKVISVAGKDAGGTDSYFSPVTLSVRAGYKLPTVQPVTSGDKGVLSVSTDRGLIVSVNGLGDIGTGSAMVSLTPGFYTVLIRNAAGRVLYQTNVRIDSGKTTLIKTSGLN